MRQAIEIIEAPLSVGVGLAGVELMAGALRDAGLQRALGAVACTATGEPLNARLVDPVTALPEPEAVRRFLLTLADRVETACDAAHLPVVIGGDCTILLGCLAGAKRLGPLGLLFLDGHTDFNKPGYPDNEPASMDLYLATGRGPAILSKLAGDAPLVEDRRVVCVGFRDEKYVEAAGGNTPAGTEITLLPLTQFRSGGFSNMVAAALDRLTADEGAFWLHFDVDALDDEAMPAVDYRMKDGLSVGECVEIIRRARQTGRMRGIDMTIYNPTLDWDGSGARLLVKLLGAALKE
ncbi:MAG: arginase family protein [Dongiaceae bacterium]